MADKLKAAPWSRKVVAGWVLGLGASAFLFSGCPLLDDSVWDFDAVSDEECTPDCDGRECGSDGCGGSCGKCGTDQRCNSSGTCVADVGCEADCSGKECGGDGCGGSCGTCSDGVCTSDGQCTQSEGVLTGTLSFDVLWPRLDDSGKLYLDQTATFPGAGMMGFLYDANSEVLASVEVAGDGSFAFPLPYASPKGDEQVVFSTMWAPDANGERVVLAVLKPDTSAYLDSNDSPPWAWSVEVGTSNNLGDLTISVDQGSGAMFVYLFMRSAMEAILYDVAAGDDSQLASLAVLWRPDLTWDCGSCYGSTIGQTVSGSIEMDQSIFIGGNSEYSSAWGYPVILHEFGHYTAHNYSRDDSPGGYHDGSPVVPPFAWSEGWASFSSVANVSRWYGAPYPLFWDKQAGFTFWIDYSDASVYAIQPIQFPDSGSGMKQDLAEDVVASMLWNVWDGGDVDEYPGSEDGVGIGTSAVLEAISSSRFIYGDRGYSGADFVDFLDAVVCRDSSVGSAVTSAVGNYGFPYDNNPSCD